MHIFRFRDRRSIPLVMRVLVGLGAITGAGAAPVTTVFLGEFGSTGSGAGQFQAPRGVTVNRVTGAFFVADSVLERVQQFDAQGNFVNFWQTQGGLQPTFSEPYGIAIDEVTGFVVVAEPINHSYQRFTTTGVFLSAFGGAGATPGSFSVPVGAAVDQRNGNIYTTDTGQDRVQYFNFGGQFLGLWGSSGSGLGEFSSPSGIAVNSQTGQVFVVDRGNNRVQRFSSTGAFETDWGSAGTAPGRFSSPEGIAISPSGLVLVVDTGNARVQIFDANGTYLHSFAARGSNPLLYGLAVDSAGIVFVSDVNRRVVSRWRLIESGDRPTLQVDGALRRRTSRTRLMLRGTASDDGGVSAVVARINGRAERPVQGTTSWRLRTRLRESRTTVRLQAIDEIDQRSPVTRVVIRRVSP